MVFAEGFLTIADIAGILMCMYMPLFLAGVISDTAIKTGTVQGKLTVSSHCKLYEIETWLYNTFITHK